VAAGSPRHRSPGRWGTAPSQERSPTAAMSLVPGVPSEDVTGTRSGGAEGGGDDGSLGSGCSVLEWKRCSLGVYAVGVAKPELG